MEFVIVSFIFVLGICLGSFYNVVGLRVPKKESIVSPGSHCTSCNYTLKPYDLIPILSYIFLKGKCRKCGTRVSVKYPIFELLTGLIFVGLYLVNEGDLVTFAFQSFFISVLLILTISDFAYHLIPDKILLSTFPLLVPIGIWLSDETIGSHLLGGIVFFGGLLLIAYLTKGGMGGGDIKLFGLIGLTMGLTDTFIVFFIACLVGSVVGISIKLVKKDTKVIPFGPYIAIGVLFTLVYGEVFWNFIINR